MACKPSTVHAYSHMMTLTERSRVWMDPSFCAYAGLSHSMIVMLRSVTDHSTMVMRSNTAQQTQGRDGLPNCPTSINTHDAGRMWWHGMQASSPPRTYKRLMTSTERRVG